jgi:hypothetical protein
LSVRVAFEPPSRAPATYGDNCYASNWLGQSSGLDLKPEAQDVRLICTAHDI